MMIGAYVQLAAAAVAIAGAAWGGYYVADLKGKNALAAEREAQRVAVVDETEVFRLRARMYERWKADYRPRAERITQEIEREIRKHPDWADQPLPDGVRRTLEAAPSEHGATREPGRSVPAVQPGSARDER